MATYTFETITAAEAASFAATDVLVFTSSGASARNNSAFAFYTSGSLPIGVSYGGKSVSFGAGLYGHNITFADGTIIYVGSPNAADVVTGSSGNDVLLGGGLDNNPGGADSINGGAGNDTIQIGGSGSANGGDGDDWIVGGQTVDGGNGDDLIAVAENTRSVLGGAGNDHIVAYDFNPTASIYIDAGSGNDEISEVFSPGSDTYIGGSGIDTLFYGASRVDLTVDLTKTGIQTVSSISGADIIIGFENLTGGYANDSLKGDGSANIIIGYEGDDTLNGDAGNDTLNPGAGRSVVIGGSGTDTLTYVNEGEVDGAYFVSVDLSTGVTRAYDYFRVAWDPGTVTGVEAVVGTWGADTIIGSTAAETLSGWIGSDSINSGGGNDQVFGGSDNDTITASGVSNTYLRGEDGDDTVFGGSGFDDINGNKGNDTAAGGTGADWVVGGQGNDLLYGGSTVAGDTSDGGNDIVYGNIGNDTCYGGAGNDIVRGGQDDDVIYGEAGNDWLSGDRGNDTMTGGAGADIFHTFSGAGIDRVLDFSLAQGDRVQLDPGTSYTLSQVGSDAVINMGNGDQMILVGVTASSLTGAWISTG